MIFRRTCPQKLEGAGWAGLFIIYREAWCGKKDRGFSAPRLPSPTKRLTEKFEAKHSILADRRRTSQNVWHTWIVLMLDLDGGGKYSSKISQSARRYLLNGKGWKVQAGHIDFAFTKFSSTGYVFINTSPELKKPYTCRGSYQYVFSCMEDSKRICSVLKLERINLTLVSVFIGHGYLQHSDGEYLGEHIMRYHVYLMPSTSLTLDRLWSSYSDSFPASTKVELTGSENDWEEKTIVGYGGYLY